MRATSGGSTVSFAAPEWNIAYRFVMEMAASNPDFIGFDDHHSASLDGSEADNAGLDDPRGASIQRQRSEREARVRDQQSRLGAANDLRDKDVLPYFLNCLSSGNLIDYAARYCRGNELQWQACSHVLGTRILHDAWQSLPQELGGGGRMDAFYGGVRHIAQPILRELDKDTHDALGAVLDRSVERHVGLIAMSAGAPPAPPAHVAPMHRPALTVIVHGTWAPDTDWWRDPAGLGATPADSLWAYLDRSGVSNLVRHAAEFCWSGKNNDAARAVAAQAFVQWWQALGSPQLNVVAHSHGGNVVLRALALEPAMSVRRLVLLGTPARIECPAPSHRIRRLFNVYSDKDTAQVLGSWGGQRGEGRTQSDHRGAVNLFRPTWRAGGVVHSAWHSDLHEPHFWRHHRMEQLLH